MPTCTIPTPIGPVCIREKDGAICAIDFTNGDLCPPGTALLAEAARQLNAYFAGTLTDFALPIRLEGTAFRMRCWESLQTIPYGETISYGEQANRIGNPKAVRAVGGANHHNPISIVVPCHRVVGADGSLTGYGGGMDKKAWLLANEKQHAKIFRTKRIDLEKLSNVYRVRRLGMDDVEEIFAFCKENTQYYAYCGAEPSIELVVHDLKTAPPGIPMAQKYYIGFYQETTLIAIMDLIGGYPDGDCVFIGFFMVNNNVQGLGIGSQIIREVLHAIRMQGFSKCLLGIDKDNPQSNHFWRKNGFEVVSETVREDGTICVAEKQL